VTLSADFTVTSGTGTYGGWLGMGFIDDSVSNPGIFGSAGPTMTLAMDGSVGALASFLTGPTTVYSGNPGVGASDVNLEIVYDNTDPNDITSSFFVNGSGIGTYSYGSTAVPFDEVFLRSYLLGGGTVQDFSLTVTSPVPDYYSSAVLLLIGMGSLVILPLSRPIFRMR